jgi:hypothetical protein
LLLPDVLQSLPCAPAPFSLPHVLWVGLKDKMERERFFKIEILTVELMVRLYRDKVTEGFGNMTLLSSKGVEIELSTDQ